MFYNGNWNYKYEFEIDGEWYPCHIYKNEDFPPEPGYIDVFTRNGSIMSYKENRVRKMSEDRYKKYTEELILFFGEEELKKYHGF